jgi:hypothetical protein
VFFSMNSVGVDVSVLDPHAVRALRNCEPAFPEHWHSHRMLLAAGLSAVLWTKASAGLKD